MRNCPYCQKEVQDEAIVCRYCGLDIDKPDWLRNKMRCPYCAEWIDRGTSLCPYCKSDLEEPIPEEDETQVAAPAPFADDLGSLRAAVESAEAEPEPPPEPPVEPAPESTVSPASRPEPRAPITAQSPYEPRPWEASLEDNPMRSVPLAAEPPPSPSGTTDLISEIDWVQLGRWGLLGLLGLGGAAGLGYLLFLLFGRGGLAAAVPLPTAIPTAEVTAAPLLAATADPTATEQASTPTPRGDCLSWDQVSLDDTGEELCVYGTVKRWFAIDDLPFVAIFTEETGSFALVDRGKAHPEIHPGDCIQGVGQVEVMSQTRPFIDLNGAVLACEPAVSQP